MTRNEPLCRHEVKLLQVRSADLAFSFAATYANKRPTPKHGLLTTRLGLHAALWGKEGISPGMNAEEAIASLHVFMNNQRGFLRNVTHEGTKLKRQLQRQQVGCASGKYEPNVRICPVCKLPISRRFDGWCHCEKRRRLS